MKSCCFVDWPMRCGWRAYRWGRIHVAIGDEWCIEEIYWMLNLMSDGEGFCLETKLCCLFQRIDVNWWCKLPTHSLPFSTFNSSFCSRSCLYGDIHFIHCKTVRNKQYRWVSIWGRIQLKFLAIFSKFFYLLARKN